MAYTPRNPNGQATMANSEPVVLASDQTDIKITLDGETIVIAAGTNNIGDVDVLTLPSLPAGNNNIGDVDVASVAGNVTVVQATAANLNVTEASAAGSLTALQLLDDTIFTAGTDTYTEATSKGSLILAVRRDADTTLVNTTNEFGPLQMDANGRLKVEVFSGETLPISGTVAATQSGTWVLGANSGVDIGDVTINNAAGASAVNIQDGGNTITVDNGGTFVTQENGAALTALQLIDNTIITDNGAFTDGTTAVNVSGYIFDEVAGTALTENDAAAARIDSKRAQVHVIEDATTRGQRMTVTTRGSTLNEGDVAHDIADAGNPVKVGGVAVSGSASPTSVASGDRTRWIFNQHGIPYMIGGHPNIITREYDFGSAAQTDVNLAAAAVAADERVYVTRFEAMCDNANTVAVSVRAGFGTASVPTASATGVSGMIASHPGLAAGSGFVSGNGTGVIAVGAAGEEPRLTSTAATTGNLHVIISYFIIDETP